MSVDNIKIATEAVTMIKAGSTEQRFPYWLNKVMEEGVTAAELGLSEKDVAKIHHQFNVNMGKEAVTMIKAGSTEQRFPYWLNKVMEEGVTAAELGLSEKDVELLLNRPTLRAV
jgi:hypothetical protein